METSENGRNGVICRKSAAGAVSGAPGRVFSRPIVPRGVKGCIGVPKGVKGCRGALGA